MIASVLTLALLLASAEKAVRAPSTIDVVVLSKQAPRALFILSGGCSIEAAEGSPAIQDLAGVFARKYGVHACGPTTKKGKKRVQTCVDRPRIEISCKQPIVVRVAKKTARAYGLLTTITSKAGVLRVIASIDREHYIAGVVGAELAAAPDEAQIAQAVVARTFALRALVEPRHDDAPLCDLTHCQVYVGSSVISSKAAAAPPRALIDRTGNPSPVFYHSTCGGKTLSARSVWGDIDAPDLIGVADVDEQGRAWCRKSPHFGWVHEVGDQHFAEVLAPIAGRKLDPASLELAAKDESGSKWKISDRTGEVEVRGSELHLGLGRALGWSTVKSSAFVAVRAGRNFRLSGHGLGHRAGLCQSGAIARAKAGQTADQILKAYFPNLEIVPVANEDPRK